MTGATSPRGDGFERFERSLPERAIAFLVQHETILWTIVIGVTVADGVLTYAGLLQGHPDGNPIVRSAIAHFGYLGIGVIKVGALAVAFGVWTVLSTRRRPFVPLALVVPWTSATLLNAITLAF